MKPSTHLGLNSTSILLFLLLLCVPFTASGAILNVPYYNQSTNNWCWAASTAMLAKYYRGEQFTQMKPAIVAAINHAGPQTGDNALCSKMMATLAFIDPTRTYVRNTTIFDLATLVRSITRDYLIEQLDLGNPLLIAWFPEEFWLSHAFLVTGYEGSDLATGHVYVHDPSGYFVNNLSPKEPYINVEMTWNQFFTRIEGWIPIGNNASCIHASGAQTSASTTMSMDLMPLYYDNTGPVGQTNNPFLEWDGATHSGYYWAVDNKTDGLLRGTMSGYETTGVSLWFNDRLLISPRVWNFTAEDRTARIDVALYRHIDGTMVHSANKSFQALKQSVELPSISLDLWEVTQRINGLYYLRLDLFDTSQSPEMLVDTVQLSAYIKDEGDALIVGTVLDPQNNPIRSATISANVTHGGVCFTKSVTSNSKGEYIMCLPRGCEAAIRASKTGYNIPDTFLHMNCVWSSYNNYIAYPLSTEWYVATTGNDAAAGTNWATAKATIQAAIDLSTDGDTVWVSNGVYNVGGITVHDSATNRVAITNAISVRSINGPQYSSIVGDLNIRCAYVGSNAVLSGFTLTNGTMQSLYTKGGGAWCAQSALIENCRITGNCADVGGGVYGGTLKQCHINNNYAWGHNDDSYMFPVFWPFDQEGGGVHSSICINCIISNNKSLVGAGAYGSTLYNCTIVDNDSDAWCQEWVGFYWEGGWSAYPGGVTKGGNGGGAYNCIVINSIVYNNIAAGNSPNIYSCIISNSCSSPVAYENGNIDVDPQLNSHYAPSESSPCIDRGNNSAVFSDTDILGNLRIMFGQVDMGAYEYPLPSGYWLWAYDISTVRTNPADSAYNDRCPNLLKYATGSDPRYPPSLSEVECKVVDSHFQFIFSRNTNANDVTFIIEESPDLLNPELWTGMVTNRFGSWMGASNIAESSYFSPAARVSIILDPKELSRYYRLRVTRP